MRNLSGHYQAVGYNSYTNREKVGKLDVVQDGSRLTGTYRFYVNFEDASPVSFDLPEEDCDVTGEVFETGDQPIPADDVAFINMDWQARKALQPDARIQFGGRTIFLLRLGSGTLLGNENTPDGVRTLPFIPL